MSTQKNSYTINRDEVATKLGISTRTLDRYVKRGKIKNRVDGRNVFFDPKEVIEFGKVLAEKSKKLANQKPKAAKINSESSATAEPVNHVENRPEEKIYEKLYHEAAVELKGKQEKLEAASFRVGQLEAQLKNSVPLLEWKQKEEVLQQENHTLRGNLNTEKLKARVFIGLAMGLAAAAVALGIMSSQL
jgi:DNA-binding transcriptional MerR regulator